VLNTHGIWLQDGQPITHTRTLEMLYKNLRRMASGEYRVIVDNEEAPVIVEDCSLFIQNINIQTGQMRLSNGHLAPLDPSSCWVGEANHFYCEIEGQPAKFLKAAYYEIAKHIHLAPGSQSQYFLHFQGRQYPIRITQQREAVNG
jgi:uncharacterized protein